MQTGGGKAVDPNAVKEERLTGTNKDLRRLSMVQSKNLLLKLGLNEDEIKGETPTLPSFRFLAAISDLAGRLTADLKVPPLLTALPGIIGARRCCEAGAVGMQLHKITARPGMAFVQEIVYFLKSSNSCG